MKVIIAGSRDIIYDPKKIERIVLMAEKSFGQSITELVCGMARGIDMSGFYWRKDLRPEIGLKEFPYADYIPEAIKKYNTRKMAGYVRNAHMADYADALIVIWDGMSNGSSSMISEMEDKGLPVFEVIVSKKN